MEVFAESLLGTHCDAFSSMRCQHARAMECVAHALQSEENPTTTVMSIDGIGAFDLISQKDVLWTSFNLDEGHVQSLNAEEEENSGPHDAPSCSHWVSMPPSPQSRVLYTMKKGCCWRFLNDLYVVTPNPDRLQDVYGIVQRELWVHSRIRNSGGVRPEFCYTHERMARLTDPTTRFCSTAFPKLRIHSLHGHTTCNAPQHEQDYLLRMVRPELVEGFAESNDMGLWTCLCRLLNVNPDNVRAKVIAGMPPCLGGLGLRSAVRTRQLSVQGELGRQPLHDQGETRYFWGHARTPCCILHHFCPPLVKNAP